MSVIHKLFVQIDIITWLALDGVATFDDVILFEAVGVAFTFIKILLPATPKIILVVNGPAIITIYYHLSFLTWTGILSDIESSMNHGAIFVVGNDNSVVAVYDCCSIIFSRFFR